MKQIIQEVLQAEEKVNGTLKEARTQAAQIKAAAEKEIATQLSEAKEETRTIVQSMVEEARQEAERLRLEKLREADRAKEILLSSRSDTLNQLVDDICQIVLVTTEEQSG